MIRRSLLTAILALAATPALAVQSSGISDPEAWTRELYGRLASGGEDPPRTVMTLRLRQAWTEAEEEGGGLDVSPFTDGKGGAISDVTVSGRVAGDATRGNRRVVTVDFSNGQPVRLVFYFVRTGYGWFIDEIERDGPGGWTLSVVLRYGRQR